MLYVSSGGYLSTICAAQSIVVSSRFVSQASFGSRVSFRLDPNICRARGVGAGLAAPLACRSAGAIASGARGKPHFGRAPA